ncbi:MAG TPA: FAD-dependent oxidoreductase [Thiolinea sp.]|nr:FAD-dependent oxidoreductase [Thiolinea sp.]
MPLTDAHDFVARLPAAPVYDLVVAGSGAAGMAAAIFAALNGSRVLLLERTEYVGGTSALSGGTTWVPLTRFLGDTETEDSPDKVMRFLDAAVGEHSPRAMRETFLKAGPDAIHTLVDQTEVQFRACAYHPDYMADLDGFTVNGRALEPLPYAANHLGKNLKLLRPPIPEFTVLGGMMVNRADINQLLKRYRSPRSFLYTVSLVLRYWRDRLVHGQAARSVMGHALIARMLASALKQGVDISINTDMTQLQTDDTGAVSAVTIRQGPETRTVKVRGGVILAGGGFGRDPEKRHTLYPAGIGDYSPTAPGSTGQEHEQALALGAYLGEQGDQPAFWAPCSVRRRKDGSTAVFPHFVFDRSKPGTLCVDQQGRRFVNESLSYHEFGKAQFNGGDSTHPAWIVCDAAAIACYGLGMVRLGGDDVRPYLADGYLLSGATLAELAGRMGVDAVNLEAAVAQMNEAARTGEDTLFQRGSTVYQRVNGDADHGPNPTLGPLVQAPFYAVKLYPCDIGSARGLVGDTDARLLRRDGSVIGGLYACGNDLDSIMGGKYPGPGITIGPGIVFGYLAARHASQRAREQVQ